LRGIEGRLAAIEAEVVRGAQARRARAAAERFSATLREIGARTGTGLGWVGRHQPSVPPEGDHSSRPRTLKDRMNEILGEAQKLVESRQASREMHLPDPEPEQILSPVAPSTGLAREANPAQATPLEIRTDVGRKADRLQEASSASADN